MPAPTITAYSDSSITVTWSALTSSANGNSDILAYELRWDNGLGTPNIELSNVLTTSYVVTGITAGTSYKFVVRARNVYGSSTLYSPEATAQAIDAPGKMDIPTVALDTVDPTLVKITWNAVALTHGSAVTQYAVQIKTSGGTYVSDASCDPQPASTEFTTRTCYVAMSTVSSITGLAVDRVIQARV
jgi:hypothetical protein